MRNGIYELRVSANVPQQLGGLPNQMKKISRQMVLNLTEFISSAEPKGNAPEVQHSSWKMMGWKVLSFPFFLGGDGIFSVANH